MASFISTDITETSLSAEGLRAKSSLLMSDIDAYIRDDKRYRKWLSRYYPLLTDATHGSRGFLNTLRGRPSLPSEGHVALSATEWARIVAAYQARYQDLGLWGKLVAYVSGDKHQHTQLASLMAVRQQLKAVEDALLADTWVQLERHPKPHTVSHKATSSQSAKMKSALTPRAHRRTALSSPAVRIGRRSRSSLLSQLASNVQQTLRRAIKVLPWYHRLLSPLRAMKTYCQSTIAPIKALAQPEATMMNSNNVTPQASSRAQSRSPAGKGKHRLRTTNQKISTAASSTSIHEATALPSQSLHSASMDFYREITAELIISLRDLREYGSKDSNTSLEALLIQMQCQGTKPSTLEELWRQQVDASKGPGRYTWLGLRVEHARMPARLVLHYGRLREGLHQLIEALKATPLSQTTLAQASTYLANVLWEGVALSDGQSHGLFHWHHQLLARLTCLCQRYGQHGALQTLASTVLALPQSLQVETVAGQAQAWWKKKANAVYHVRAETFPDNWRLLHQQAMTVYDESYQQKRMIIETLIRYSESTTARAACDALCAALDGPLRQGMVFAPTAAAANESRRPYGHRFHALHEMLQRMGAQKRFALNYYEQDDIDVLKGLIQDASIDKQILSDALVSQLQTLEDANNPYKTMAFTVTDTAKLSTFLSDNHQEHLSEKLLADYPSLLRKKRQLTVVAAASSSSMSALDRAVEAGVVTIHPELIPFLDKYIATHPNDVIGRYAPSFDEVPVDKLPVVLGKCVRLTEKTQEQQLIIKHRNMVSLYVGIRKDRTRKKAADKRTEEADQRAEQERQRAEQERQRAEQERQRAEEERKGREEAKQRAEKERKGREEERQRAEKAEQRAEEAEQRSEADRQRIAALEQKYAALKRQQSGANDTVANEPAHAGADVKDNTVTAAPLPASSSSSLPSSRPSSTLFFAHGVATSDGDEPVEAVASPEATTQDAEPSGNEAATNIAHR